MKRIDLAVALNLATVAVLLSLGPGCGQEPAAAPEPSRQAASLVATSPEPGSPSPQAQFRPASESQAELYKRARVLAERTALATDRKVLSELRAAQAAPTRSGAIGQSPQVTKLEQQVRTRAAAVD